MRRFRDGSAAGACRGSDQRRAAQLSRLVEENPAAALSMAFSPELVADLAARFPESAGRLEAHGTWEGPIQVWVTDYANGSHKTVHRIRAGDESLELYFGTPEPPDIKGDAVIQVTGIRVGGLLLAANAATQPAKNHERAAGEAMASTEAVFAPASTTPTICCSTTGVQNIAVFLVLWPGVTPPSYLTSQAVYRTFFGTSGRSLDAYWREVSYGKTSAVGNVFGWYTLSTAYGCNNTTTTDGMVTETFAQPAAAGVNLQSYTNFVFVTPDFGCGTAGSASVGPMTDVGYFAGWADINGTNWMSSTDDALKMAAHELGHNLGLNHSNSRAFSGEALGPLGIAGTEAEYGDFFSAMTNGALGHYGAPHKAEILKWLPNYQLVQTSGVYTIQPLETATTALQALKIQRGTGGNGWLWIEYRQPVGNYDITFASQGSPWSNQGFSGALIHYEDSLTPSGHTDLLDFTPASGYAFYDPALAAGQSWTDPYSNLSIAVQSATSSGLTVQVSYGISSCTQANPVVAVSPPNASAVSGVNANYSISVTNNDGAGPRGSPKTGQW